MFTSNFADYLDYNAQFAATDAKTRIPEIPFIPFRQLYLIPPQPPPAGRPSRPPASERSCG
jgi:hypothetical protein